MQFEEIKYRSSRLFFTTLLGILAVVLGGLTLLGGQPILAGVILVVALIVLTRLRAPLLIRVDGEGVTYGWQWMGLAPKKMPWTMVKNYELKEISLYVRDGKTQNIMTQLPQTALILTTKKGFNIHLGIDQVSELRTVLTALNKPL